jgi:hypothetical protein
MHPLLLDKLAADRISTMRCDADARRRARLRPGRRLPRGRDPGVLGES